MATRLLDTLASFFGTDAVTWSIETSKTAVPRVEQTTRTSSAGTETKQFQSLNVTVSFAKQGATSHESHVSHRTA